MNRWLLVLILFAHPAFGAIALVNHTSGVGTSTLNTTSCSTHCLLSACVYGYAAPPTGFSDSLSNFWQSTAYYDSGGAYIQLFYSFTGNVGSDTFTATGGYASMAVSSWTGVASGPDQQAGAAGASAGPITPANPNELVLSCMGVTGGSAATINSPFTILDQIAGGAAGAYVIQTSATAATATWSNGQGTGIYSFFAVSDPGPLSVTTSSMPEGFVSTAYSTSLQAQGGVSPYTWSQTAGTLPTGLGLTGGTGIVAGTPSATVLNSAQTFKVTDSNASTASSSGLEITIAAAALSIGTTTCPGGTQLASYAGCTMTVSGGTSPYTWSVDATKTYAPLPEGLAIDTSTGAITSSLIGGQGKYVTGLVATDSQNSRAEQPITFAMSGNNTFASSVFPSNSIFHHRMDAATTSLPVDSSPAAPIPSDYTSSTIQAIFGTANGNFPFGIPMIEVPNSQTLISTVTTMYQCYWGTTTGPYPCYGSGQAPIPSYAPIEGTSYFSNASMYEGDGHVLVYQEAGGGNPPALWEMFTSQQIAGGNWDDGSNALWPDVSGNNLTTQGNGTTDAAGLPLMPLLENADEVIGTGTPSTPNGTPAHPIRFTLNHILNNWVWPATDTSGTGSCTGVSTGTQISQSSPPSACTWSAPPGEIYRLKASVSNPSCAATSPQAAIIIMQMRNYGIIVSDNGISGGLIGTPDARWNDSDLNCLTNLTLANFEPVNVSSLIVSNDSGQTPGSGTPVSINNATLRNAVIP